MLHRKMSENASLRHLRSQAKAFFGLAMDPNFFGRVKLTLNFDSTLAQGATAILKSVPLNPASKGNMKSSSSTRRWKRQRKSKKNKKKNDDKATASEGQPAAAAAVTLQRSIDLEAELLLVKIKTKLFNLTARPGQNM